MLYFLAGCQFAHFFIPGVSKLLWVYNYNASILLLPRLLLPADPPKLFIMDSCVAIISTNFFIF